MTTIINAATSGGLIQTADTSGILQLQTASTAAMTIDASQNVGIGTSSPTNGRLVISGSSVTTGQGIRLVADTADARFICESATLGAGILGTFSNHSQLFYTNSTERMRIDGSGNVGIGTTAPQQRLGIKPATNVPQLYLIQDNVANDGYKLFADSSAGYLSFLRTSSGSDTERMRIDSSGNLLVGTTTTYGTETVARGTSGYTYASLSISNQADHFIFKNDATTVGSITRVGGSGVAYNNTSDYRLKENVAPITGALNKVSQLKPCTYTWKLDGSGGQGFIAHELQAVIPDAVSGEKDAVEEDGTIKPQGIDQSRIVATLTAAIQEQQALITDLTTRLAALEGAK